MILFTLRCTQGHEFDGWFRDSDAYEAQQATGDIACPECGDNSVDKALMAPRLARSRDAKPLSPTQMKAMLLAMRRQVETHCDYVGERFAEEARRIHSGEIEAHGIYGEATEEQSRALADEGIEVGRIPWISPDA